MVEPNRRRPARRGRRHGRPAVAVAVAVAVLGLAACAEDAPATSVAVPATVPFDAAAVVATAGPSVWRVETEGCGWIATGSAVAVDDHHLLTNHHVILHDTAPVVRSTSGAVLQGRVVAASEDPDVAVIAVDEPIGPALTLAPAEVLAPGEPLVALGYPVPDLEFEATTGSIVRLLGPGATVEALLTDVPVDKGNSGGAAVRADGSVAGLVTQMTSDDRQVAIVLTTSSLQGVLEQARTAPADVLSDCGRGPDYLPPVPEQFGPIEVPPPAPPPQAAAGPVPTLPVPTTVPPTTAAAGPPPTAAPPTTRAAGPPPPPPCPSGAPTTVVTGVSAFPTDTEGIWEVTVDGTVRNDATAAVDLRRIEVQVTGDPPVTADAVSTGGDLQGLPPGQEVAWRAEMVVQSSDAPYEATTTLTWRWAAPAVANACPDGDPPA